MTFFRRISVLDLFVENEKNKFCRQFDLEQVDKNIDNIVIK